MMFSPIISLLFLLYLSYTTSKLKPITSSIQVGNLKMSPIGGGTWSWGNQFLWNYKKDNDNELEEVFKYATTKGINWFDTADSYGTGSLSGRSESLLGEFLSRNYKKNIYFCTKIAPFPWRIGKQSMINCFQASKDRMNKPVDMLQLHWPPSLGWQESNYLDAFSDIIQSRDAIQVGMSNFGPIGLRRVDQIMKDKGIKIHSNQVQFSLLSRAPLTSGLTDTCEELKIQPIAYSPLALGLLTDKYTIDNLPNGPRFILFREYLPIMKPLLDELRDVAKKRNKSVAQVQENLGAVGWSLTPAEILCIDKAADKVPKSLIQNPNQSD